MSSLSRSTSSPASGNSRSRLFEGSFVGGSSSSSSGGGGSSSRGGNDGGEDEMSLLESQNDSSLNALHQKIRAIKGISINLHDDVNDQNRMLDTMSQSFTSVGDGIKSSTKRIQVMLSTPHGQQTCTMVGLIVLLVVGVWILWAKWSR
ncbi:hypothetical protein DFJ73DRAFT_842891 [Zopfochytrium polystomum]|nr:hypothetical protein DFJ73DRAFT_842891 [Zopfochytrium polystomum]